MPRSAHGPIIPRVKDKLKTLNDRGRFCANTPRRVFESVRPRSSRALRVDAGPDRSGCKIAHGHLDEAEQESQDEHPKNPATSATGKQCDRGSNSERNEKKDNELNLIESRLARREVPRPFAPTRTSKPNQ